MFLIMKQFDIAGIVILSFVKRGLAKRRYLNTTRIVTTENGERIRKAP